MTYATFLLIFLLGPSALLILALALRRRLSSRRFWFTVSLLSLPVLLAMAPWDHTAVAWGIWNWTPQQTWGLRLWLIPPEEYLFSLLETLLTSLLVYALLQPWQRRPRPRPKHEPEEP